MEESTLSGPRKVKDIKKA